MTRHAATVQEGLESTPERFEFFQAVRLLEAFGAVRDGAAPVGLGSSPGHEAVRFRGHASWRFPATAIREVRPLDDGRHEMVVEVMGMLGAVGALPDFYTRLVLDRRREKDDAFEAFLDLFVHRLVSLYHRAWERSRLAPSYERSARSGSADDPFTALVRHLVGYGGEAFEGTLQAPDEVLFSYGAAYLPRPRSSIRLERLLSDHLGAPVAVDEWTRQWLEIDEGDRSVLPSRANPVGRHARLGVDFVLGRGLWDRGHSFDVHIGPIDYATFLEFVPPRRKFAETCDLVAAYVGPEFSFALRPVLATGEVPLCSLGEPVEPGESAEAPGTIHRHGETAPRLGLCCWLSTRPNDTPFDGADFASARDRLEREDPLSEEESW